MAIRVDVFARRAISIIIADKSVCVEMKLKIAIAEMTVKSGVLKRANRMKRSIRKKFNIGI